VAICYWIVVIGYCWLVIVDWILLNGLWLMEIW